MCFVYLFDHFCFQSYSKFGWRRLFSRTVELEESAIPSPYLVEKESEAQLFGTHCHCELTVGQGLESTRCEASPVVTPTIPKEAAENLGFQPLPNNTESQRMWTKFCHYTY